MEDERAKDGSGYTFGDVLDALSVEELKLILDEMQIEKARIEAEIEKKMLVRGAAESVFKI